MTALVIESIFWLTTLRCTLIPVAFNVIRNTINPNYASPACLMKLVNGTQPSHFEAHPFYSGLSEFTQNAECDLQLFVDNQYDSELNKEGPRLTTLLTCLVIFTVLWNIFDESWKKIFNLKIIFLGYFIYIQGSLFMSWSHFGQDIVYFAGNIMHHTDISEYRSGSNASFVNGNMPQGMALISVLTVFWNIIVQIKLLKLIPSLKREVTPAIITLLNVAVLCYVIKNLKVIHPFMHENAKESWLDAPRWTLEWRAAQHVFVHHGNGDSFGPSMYWDPFFSKALYLYSYFHNACFHLIPESFEHYGFAIGFDILLGCFTSFLTYICLFIPNFIYETITGPSGLDCVKTPHHISLVKYTKSKGL
jgi:hypothetical protein